MSFSVHGLVGLKVGVLLLVLIVDELIAPPYVVSATTAPIVGLFYKTFYVGLKLWIKDRAGGGEIGSWKT